MSFGFNRGKTYGRKDAVSLIGEASQFHGDLHSPSDIRVEGEFHGLLHAAGEVAIGERGAVYSTDLRARELVVAGRLEGCVEAEGCVRITPTGRVMGTVRSASLIIEPGAVFQGTSVMFVPGEDAAPSTVMI